MMIQDPILDAFSSLCRRHGDRVLMASPERRATAGEIAQLSRRLQQRLVQAGLPPGSLVALALGNGPAFAAAFLALLEARCAALLLDATAPAERQCHVAGTLGARALVHGAPWPSHEEEVRLEPLPGVREPAALPPEIRVLKLTSGSTGEPRGILTPSAALVADDAALAVTMGLGDDERILAAIPMSHSYGLSSVLMPALVRGSLLVVPEPGHPLNAMTAARALDVTFLPTVPAYLQALLKMAEPPPCPASLRRVITAGALLKAETAERFRQVYGRPVQVFYGASECGGICFDREGTAAERGTLGSPVEGVRVTLEGGDSEGGCGLVTVRSEAVATAYYPAADERLAGGRFRTGDLGRFEGGELMLAGRNDDLINVKGKKVNPREVEALLGRLPGVEDVAVLGLARCDGGFTVRAVVACPEGSLTYRQVHAWCRDHLADHKVPRSIVLVRDLPRTERGKLDRAALCAVGDESG